MYLFDKILFSVKFEIIGILFFFGFVRKYLLGILVVEGFFLCDDEFGSGKIGYSIVSRFVVLFEDRFRIFVYCVRFSGLF